MGNNVKKDNWYTSGPLFEESLKPQIMLIKHDPNSYKKMKQILSNAREHRITERRRQLKRLNPDF